MTDPLNANNLLNLVEGVQLGDFTVIADRIAVLIATALYFPQLLHGFFVEHRDLIVFLYHLAGLVSQ